MNPSECYIPVSYSDGFFALIIKTDLFFYSYFMFINRIEYKKYKR